MHRVEQCGTAHSMEELKTWSEQFAGVEVRVTEGSGLLRDGIGLPDASREFDYNAGMLHSVADRVTGSWSLPCLPLQLMWQPRF